MIINYYMQVKDGASFCNCTYILHISGWSKKDSFLTVLPAKTEIFYKHAVKADLGKGYWNPKRKLDITMHFSE